MGTTAILQDSEGTHIWVRITKVGQNDQFFQPIIKHIIYCLLGMKNYTIWSEIV